MLSRTHRAPISFQPIVRGYPQLTLAKLMIEIEHGAKIFFHPLMLGGFFVALAWLGVFTSLYPWLHLIALVLFTIYFFRSLGRSRAVWKKPKPSQAQRRVELASGLAHRPLDVLNDRPANGDEIQMALWQEHRARAEHQVRNLRWPKWMLSLAGYDPYGLRYAVLASLIVGLVIGWGGLGGRLVSAINPAVGHWYMARPALDAWITPPAATHLPPIMIATPAGAQHNDKVIDVPEGSKLSAHLAEKNGDVPTLKVNDHTQKFVSEDQKDFEASAILTGGEIIKISRGWQTLGAWKIRVIPDRPPRIAFAASPAVTERKSLRLPVEAEDDYGLTSIKLRVTPSESLPGVSNDPIEITLGAPETKTVKRMAYEDLTASPWAGLPVHLQLVATNSMGREAASAPVDFVLPERDFFNPLARMLIEERKKLLQSPFDDGIRNEAANLMAGIAHQTASYRGDPLVLMALRVGAVRLVIDHADDATASVADILWQTAVRIEEGNASTAEANLRQAQKDLADALDNNASEKDIQRIIDRLHQALAQYLAELATHSASRPGPTEDLSQALGMQTNMLSPDDLQRMLDNMLHLSATGARDAARDELSRMQHLLENLRTGPVQMNASQRAELQDLKSLQTLIHDQQGLIDETFRSAAKEHKNGSHDLAAEQDHLLKRLQDIVAKANDQSGKLEHGSDAMQRAEQLLRQGAMRFATEPQNEALKAMQDAMQSMQEDLRQGMFLLPSNAMGTTGSDPFGREGNGFLRDDGIKLPDQMEVRRVRQILDELQRRSGDMTRPKIERDYLDRLLRNF